MPDSDATIHFKCVKCGQVLRVLRPTRKCAVECPKCTISYAILPDGQVVRQAVDESTPKLPPAPRITHAPAAAKDFHRYTPVQAEVSPVATHVPTLAESYGIGPQPRSTGSARWLLVAGLFMLLLVLLAGIGFLIWQRGGLDAWIEPSPEPPDP